MHGAQRPVSTDIVAGARLGPKDANRPIRLVALDDSTGQAGSWTPARTAADARRAAQGGALA
jgi:hypothetical protein